VEKVVEVEQQLAVVEDLVVVEVAALEAELHRPGGDAAHAVPPESATRSGIAFTIGVLIEAYLLGSAPAPAATSFHDCRGIGD
jgi:hypothetical protein